MTPRTTDGAALRPFFWEGFAPGQAYAGGDLAAARSGWGRGPGTVPAMRGLHRVRRAESDQVQEHVSASFAAEHAVLTLFAAHQGGGRRPVHQAGVGLGTACRRLLLSRVFSDAAVERRLVSAATALDLDELVHHLRGVVALLRQGGIVLDYTRLFHDLRSWSGGQHDRTVRCWGLQFTDRAATDTSHPDPTAAGEGGAAEPPAVAGGRPYWEICDPRAEKTGAALAALRSGAGRQAGAVPAMWSYYRARVSAAQQESGVLGRGLVAEHTALTLFAVHQQGRGEPMHVRGRSPGGACQLLLRKDAKADRAAWEGFFGALVTSVDAGELAHHLGRLARRLRHAGVGLDYTGLARALLEWDDPRHPDEQARIRARWDRDFRVAPTSQP